MAFQSITGLPCHLWQVHSHQVRRLSRRPYIISQKCKCRFGLPQIAFSTQSSNPSIHKGSPS
jgi:hypothetical protein